MTHRPALEALVCAIDVPSREAMDLIADYRAEVAHELAEKQRAAAEDWGYDFPGFAETVSDLTDLIDPKKEGQ